MNKNKRRLWQSFVTTVLLGVLPGLLQFQAASAASDPVLDQSQTLQNTSGMVGIVEPRLGEVFTAGVSGILDRVSVMLENYAPDPACGPVNISIRAVTDEGLPSEEEVGSGTIPLSAIPPAGSPAWVDVLLVSPARVTADTGYALLLSISTNTIGDCFVLWGGYGGADFKPYPRGYQVVKPLGNWEKVLTNQDQTFTTYVWPTSLDQSQTALPNHYDYFGAGQRVAQTFTAGLYGMLDQVSVELVNDAETPTIGPVTVEIYRAYGSYTFGLPVGAGLIPSSAVPPFPAPAWVDASVSDTYVTPGSQYAVVLSTSDLGRVHWAGNQDASAYPEGNELIGMSGWVSKPYDMSFETYVLPSSVDAAQLGTEWWDAFYDREPRAQTFTVSRSGVLDRVSVFLGFNPTQVYPPTAPISVSIQTLDSRGAPSGTQIASGTIPLSKLVSSGAWVVAELSPVYVTAGSRYALVLYINDQSFIRWLNQPHYPYGDGVFWWFEDGRGWTTYGLETQDAAFQTYVIPAAARAGLTDPAVATGTSLISSANPSVVGQPVAYTASVSPVPDGGSILFQDNGSDIEGCTAVSLDTTGEAVCTTIHGDPGSEAITASYSGNGDFAPSHGALSQDVQYAIDVLHMPDQRGKAGSTIPIKIALMNFAGENVSASDLQVQALCVVPASVDSTDPCAAAAPDFDWTDGTPRYFRYLPMRGRGGSYMLNLKTTGLDVGPGAETYQLLFREIGEPATVYHDEAGVTFELRK
jgi:hypothetical protein